MLLTAVVLGLLTVSSLAEKKPKLTKTDCFSEPDKGDACRGKKPVLRYYYDTKLEECLPFRYEGCGGNKNNYQTPSSCYQACAKVDTERHSCGGGEKATGRCKSIKDCSKGSVCRMKTLRSGVCCERKREEEYNKDKNPKCKGGKVLIRTASQGGWKPLHGRSCSQNFCPEHSECVQGRYLAHCCGEKHKFRRTRA
ncbi:Kunitz/Bovine pancreatic trypsin inhibitor domain protein [Oesophagostomum dentatum]|uniref:Kunitz/Bovine pancreatic trypsin inhibitor domain protein n=1 Tax=Oesophagostomum dentatum TaxID=61180 RepID=A0A0B1T499_OESDE|nr:Kunitz/Bovine pancreatic trypsin inhibitor domain protein [Oesophagostomum dentatum]